MKRRIVIMLSVVALMMAMLATATTAMAVNPDKQSEKCAEAELALLNVRETGDLKDIAKAEKKVDKYCRVE